MSQTGSESKEAKQYLSSVKIERSDTSIIFSFTPAVPTEEISNEMQDYFGDDILDKGGDVEINEIEGKSCITQIVIPKSFARKIILGVFRNLEKEGICPAITENDLDKSRKSGETLAEISARRKGTSRAIQTAVAPVRQQKVEVDERREGPRFGVQARVTDAEKRNNDVRMNVDAYLYIGTRNNNRDYERVEPVIFEYNGVQKQLISSRIGKIRNRTLIFRDVFESRAKLRVWPKAFPDEVIEITVNPWEARPTPPTPPAGTGTQAGPAKGGRTEVTRAAPGEPPPPVQGTQHRPPPPPDNDGENLAREVAHEAGKVNEGFKRVEEKRKAEFAKQKEEFEAKLKENEQREEALKKQVADMEKRIEELDEKKRKEDEEKARLEKEKAEAEEKARKEAEELAQRQKEEKEQQEAELKRIGNAAADYLIYADIAYLLPAQEKNKIEQIGIKLRNGEVEGSNKKYAETLMAMRAKYTPQKVEQASTDIWVELKNLLSDIDIPMSPYTASKSWVYWDMAKQQYLSEHPAESKPEYKLGNPMEDAKTCRQITDRHFGWELYGKYRTSPDAQQKIDSALQNFPYAPQAHQLLAKDPNSRETLSSFELEVLGKIVRTSMEFRKQEEQSRIVLERQEEQAQQEFEDSLRNGSEMKAEYVRALLSHRGRVEIQSGQVFVMPKEKFEVHADIVIEQGGELHVGPGTQLLFEEGAGIVNRGLIKAKGSANEPIVFASIEDNKPWKNISIEGDEQNLLEHCIIEGGSGRFYKTDRQNGTAVLDETTDAEFAAMGKAGETLKKNRSTKGGGIACINGCENTVLRSVQIRRCKTLGMGEVDKKKDQVITSGEGGGIWNFGASPSMTSVVCKENESSIGGGIHIDGGRPHLFSVTCENNNATIHGGGISIVKGSPVVATSSIRNNRAGEGGGIYITTDAETLPHLTDNKISNNTARGQGGGLYLSLGYDQTTADGYFPLIENGNINVNQAKEGGGVYIYHNISKWSYDFMRHNYALNLTNTSGNTSDDIRERFLEKNKY